MPRILRRLVQTIQREENERKYFPLTKDVQRKKSLHTPILSPRPSFNPSNYQKSILLRDPSSNVITHSRLFERHKSLPPCISLPSNVKARDGELDPPRQMTKQERRWWTNPYLRMLSSPIRLCIETDQYLPTDLLVRLSFLRLPPSRLEKMLPSVALVPDGLLHTKFTARKSGKGFYVLCLRDAVNRMLEQGKYRRINRGTNVLTNARLVDQIAHLLRLRVLQELDLLADRLQHQIQTPIQDGNPHTLIRRLTREELASIKSTGVIPFENAVAVLVVPPVNKNPITKQRPQGSMSAMPPDHELSPPKPLPPLSILMPMSSNVQPPSNGSALSGLLPNPHTPFYNGLTAFPSRSQRAALYGLLMRLLDLERERRYASRSHISKSTTPRHSSKPSHAFLLCADSQNLERGDMAAVAIALWRLRMFEGSGWAGSGESWSLGTDHAIQQLL